MVLESTMKSVALMFSSCLFFKNGNFSKINQDSQYGNALLSLCGVVIVWSTMDAPAQKRNNRAGKRSEKGSQNDRKARIPFL